VGIVERKERHKAELRERILDAARAIVLEHGFDGLSMRKIADAIEYSPATIYLHFAGRDELAMQLCRDGFNELIAFMAPVLKHKDPYERIFAMGRLYVEFGLTHPETYRMLFMEDPKFSSELVGSHKAHDKSDPGWQAFGLLRDTVAQLMESGKMAKRNPDAVAEAIWASLHGIVSLRLVCQESMFQTDVRELTDLMEHIMVHGLAA